MVSFFTLRSNYKEIFNPAFHSNVPRVISDLNDNFRRNDCNNNHHKHLKKIIHKNSIY